MTYYSFCHRFSHKYKPSRRFWINGSDFCTLKIRSRQSSQEVDFGSLCHGAVLTRQFDKPDSFSLVGSYTPFFFSAPSIPGPFPEF